MSDAAAFLAQNEDCAAGLRPDQLAKVEDYAEHHAGGLFDLARPTSQDDVYVKMHDNWGDPEDGSIVVHLYNADHPDDLDDVHYFTSASEAFDLFENIEPPRRYTVGLPVVITVHDDGRVSYWIDTAEAGQEVREIDDQDVDERHLAADADRIDADHNRRMEGTR